MLTPLGPASGPTWSTPTSSAPPSREDAPGESFRPSNEELTRDLQHRILMANINFELQRGAGPPPPEDPPPQNHQSSAGMIQNAGLNMDVGEMKGPLTPEELWGGYLIPKHNPWR